MPHQNASSAFFQRGFTLVELSIVVVIIGLLVGGAVAGQTMLKQARLMRSYDSGREVVTATQIFQEKYQALPGDFAQASDYWPDAARGTYINGDGDGLVEYRTDNGPLNAETVGATYMLAKSDLLPQRMRTSQTYDQSYWGITDTRASKYTYVLTRRSFSSAWYPTTGAMNFVYAVRECKTGYCPLDTNLYDTWWDGPNSWAFTSDELQALDTKLDDGIAYSGKLHGVYRHGHSNPQCSALPTTQEYVPSIEAECMYMGLWVQ